MEDQLDRIAKALDAEDPDYPTVLQSIAHALESIAKSMDPSFRRLDLLHDDFRSACQQVAEEIKAAKPVQAVPLTGQELLDKVKDLGDVSKSALVRACGYVTIKKDGGDRLNFTSFYEALLEAKGVDLEELKQEVS